MSDNDLEMIKGPGNATRILVFLVQDSAPVTIGLLQRGCHGVLTPGFPVKLLQRAIPAILAGELWAPRLILSEMLKDLLKARSAKRVSSLTPREERVLALVGRGYKNAEIAASMFISQETVRWHKRRLYRKIGGPHISALPATGRIPSSSADLELGSTAEAAS